MGFKTNTLTSKYENKLSTTMPKFKNQKIATFHFN